MIKRILDKLKIEFNYISSIFKFRGKELAIFDKFYPNTSYTWRTKEFNFLLTFFDTAVLFSESNNYKGKRIKSDFIQDLKILKNNHHEFNASQRVKFLSRPTFTYNFKYKLVYFLFFEDAVRFFPFLNRTKTPFAFTLYPGGGFLIDNEAIDSKLKLICNSTICKGIFVNGKFVQKYLIEKLKVLESKITLVPGVPLYLNQETNEIKRHNENFVVGFCARKYHDRGKDKGFDVFAQVALRLSDKANLKFVCIGDFTVEDLNEEEKEKTKIHFTGLLQGNQFIEQLNEFDVIISPVKTGLNGGDFDGFPTAAVVEASIMGVTMVCSDPLNDNLYENGEEIIILKSHADDYLHVLEYLIENREDCRKIGMKGRARTLDLYDDANTLLPKVQKINFWLNEQ
jgi:glycosyltransferase involved in cell wall biosynthesis